MKSAPKMWPMRTNTQRTMRAYLDAFTIGHASGIIGESAFQNPIDAAYKGELQKVRVNVYVDVQKGILKIRDRGTRGMDHCSECDWGIVHGEDGDDHQCENFLNCGWATFHSAAQEGKGSGALGSRGLGSSLALLAGEGGVIVRTKIAMEGNRHKSMASRITLSDVVVGNWGWELAPDEAWNFKEDVGTEIEVVRLKKELIDAFNDPQAIVDDYILPYWFPSIEKGVEVSLLVTGHKTIKINRGMTENLFPSVPQKNKSTWQSMNINVRKKKVGSISNLRVFLAPVDQPVSEHLQGIALIKGGRQVITRIQSFGANIDSELQSRLYGWVDTGRLLDPYETSNHLDYDHSNVVVKKTYEQIKDAVKSFLEPFNQEKQQNEPISKKDNQRARKIKEAINKAFEEVPEFNPWDEGEEPVDEKCKKCGEKPCVCIKPPPPEPDSPRITSMVFEPKEQPYSIGDEVTTRVTISNTIDRDYPQLHLKWKAQNSHGETVEEGIIEPEEFGVLPRGDNKEPGQITHECTINISTGEGAYSRGKNYFSVEIMEESHSGEESNLDRIDKRGRWFWVERKPEPPGSGGSTLNSIACHAHDAHGLDAFFDFHNRDLYIFTKHGPNIAPYWGKRGKHRIGARNSFHAAGDQILREILARNLANFDGELTPGAITSDEGLLQKVLLDKAKWVAAAQKAFGD